MENASFAVLLYLEDGVKFRKENRPEIQILKQVQDDITRPRAYFRMTDNCKPQYSCHAEP
jgi:hypothetical protein